MSADEGAWREHLGVDVEPLPGTPALRCSIATIGRSTAVLARWNFEHQGGSFGADDTTAFVAATDIARERGLPLVTVLRSGGTRLPEGMRALVGIPRAALALTALRRAGLPHLSVADNPTTGGVWVSIGSGADIRIAIRDAFIGFSGPRVVEAMTGRRLDPRSGSAQAAYDAGLVDVLAEPVAVAELLGSYLHALRPDEPEPNPPLTPAEPPPDAGDRQVAAEAAADRPNGRQLIEELLDERIPLRGADPAVGAVIGRLSGRRVVAVALAAKRGRMPGPGGFRLLERCAGLGGALSLPVVCLVDTPGADPHTEASGLSPAIAEATLALLSTSSPTLSLVHGAGGSGGALAAAVTDVVGVGRYGWFAALGPSGAAAALRIEPAEASRLMNLTPADLLDNRFADEYVAPGTERRWIAGQLDRLGAQAEDDRRARRLRRWSAPLD
jgi:acetyl-CoA carboxylase carboxyl transferase subunit beta